MAVYKYTTTQPVDFAIFAGHGNSEKDNGFDPGATGAAVTEHELVKEVAVAVCEKLSQVGYDVLYDEQNFKDNDLKGVTVKSKFALSLHANAHNTQARGVEALVPAKEPKLDFEFNVVNRIAALGTSNRGVKSRDLSTEKTDQRTNGTALNYTDYYGEIREAWRLGISLTILEMFFVDNVEDVAFYRVNKDAIIDIIVDELKKLVNSSNTVVQPEQPTPPKPAEPQKPTTTGEVIEKRYPEKHTFIPNVAEGGIYVRKSPNFNDKDNVMYYNGEVCPARGQYYHEVVITNKYVYIVYKRSNGTLGYLPVRERGGQLWGTIK